MNKRVIGIVQARMGSTRLKEKMMKKIDCYPLIYWVLQRTLKSNLTNKIILAATTNSNDDRLVEVANNLKIDVFRGSETNVIDRFIKASEKYNADYIVRICADNPFIDGQEIDRLIKEYFSGEYDYAFNNCSKKMSRYSDGFGAEIISYHLLKKISNLPLNNSQEEHVTKYIWDNLPRFKILALKSPKELAYPDLKFDIDTLEDFEYIRLLISNGVKINSKADEIVKIALRISKDRY